MRDTVDAPKYLKLAADLEEQIRTGELPVGSFLPSQAILMQETALSLSTVRQAVAALTERGLVRPEHGRGVRILANQSRLPDIRSSQQIARLGIAIMEPNPHHTVYREVINGVSDALKASRTGMLVRYSAGDGDDDSELAALLDSCDAIILLGTVTPAHAAQALASGLPVILAGHAVESETENQMSCVKWDLEAAGALAVQALSVHPQRRVTMITETLATTFQKDFYRSLQQAATESGYESDRLVLGRGTDHGARLDAFLQAGDSAAVMVGAPLTAKLLACFQQAGGDLSAAAPPVLALTDLGPIGGADTPPVPRLVFPHKRLGRVTAETILTHPHTLCSRLLPPRLENVAVAALT